MSEFEAYFQLGFFHIIALDGIDHILFLVALSAIYPLKDWKKILILVTAFTIGHSITLILAGLDYIPIDKKIIELLIPITIFITAVENLFTKIPIKQNQKVRYIVVILFGLIHGLAFAKDLKALFALSQEGIILKLLAFNIGIEIGQSLIVLVILIFSITFVSNQITRLKIWNYILSGIAALAALVMIFYKLFF